MNVRPRWLRGWSWWVDTRPTGAPGYDPRPLWRRVAAFLGIRKEW